MEEGHGLWRVDWADPGPGHPEGPVRMAHIQAALDEEPVKGMRILSRDLLPHNIIAVKEQDRYRVMLVDGIGNAELIPLSSWSEYSPRIQRAVTSDRMSASVRLDDGVKLASFS